MFDWVKDKFLQDGGVIENRNYVKPGTITAGKISVSDISADNIGVQASILHLSEALDNMIYYDGTYLVIKQDERMEFYHLNDDKDKCEIKLKENLVTTFNGEKIKKSSLPTKIRSVIVKEEI